MATFFLTFIFLLLLITAMAVGAIFKNKPIKGSCGGLSAIGMKDSCAICGGDENTKNNKDVDESLFFDATKP